MLANTGKILYNINGEDKGEFYEYFKNICQICNLVNIILGIIRYFDILWNKFNI